MLQEGWQEAKTETGRSYWWHEVTRESRWEAPRLEASSPPHTERDASGKKIDGKKSHLNDAGAFRGPANVLYNPDWRTPGAGGSALGCLCGLECEDPDELALHNPW